MSCVIEGLEADRLAALAEARRLRDENGELRAEVADLKARLRAARRGQMGMPCPTIGLHECWCSECVGLNATDLRVKDWRKP